MIKKTTYALILNWNGWADTLLCLESLLRCASTDLRIAVWDNGSSDGSADHIGAWAQGRLEALPLVPESLRARVFPPTPKPLSLAVIEPGQQDHEHTVVVIRGRENLGYAGGNNAAMRWALAQADCAQVWLLNNDIVVAAEALTEMQAAAASDRHDRPIGAYVHYMDEPARLQACGGQRLGRGPLVAPRYVQQAEHIDYLVGASLFLSRTRLQSLGFFNEDYFLNAEDLEFTYPYKRAFALAHPDTPAFLVAGRIWHRESTTQSRNRFLHTYYYTRNLLYAAAKLGRAQGLATLTHALARLTLATLRGHRLAARGIARGIRDWRAGIVGPYRSPQ